MFMKTQKEEFPIERMSKVFGVSVSGYYAWSKRVPSLRERENEKPFAATL